MGIGHGHAVSCRIPGWSGAMSRMKITAGLQGGTVTQLMSADLDSLSVQRRANANYTAMVSARRKTPGLARGLVRPRAKLKTDGSYVSEFHSELH